MGNTKPKIMTPQYYYYISQHIWLLFCFFFSLLAKQKQKFTWDLILKKISFLILKCILSFFFCLKNVLCFYYYLLILFFKIKWRLENNFFNFWTSWNVKKYFFVKVTFGPKFDFSDQIQAIFYFLGTFEYPRTISLFSGQIHFFRQISINPTGKFQIFSKKFLNPSKMVNDNSGKNFGRSWMSCLPEGVGHINDISNEAVWTLSSAKGFFGTF